MKATKLFIGQQLREIREEHKLTQAKFASQLGISTSYINQMENNQRHVTASVLMGLAEHYGVDIASLSKQDGDRLIADLMECFADPVFNGKTPSAHELRLATQNSPAVARSLITLHQTLRRTSDRLAELDSTINYTGSIVEPTPYEEVRDYFHFINNYVHDLDIEAEKLASSLKANSTDRYQSLSNYINETHGVVVSESDSADSPLRTFDKQTKRLQLNRHTLRASKAFQIAHQIALLEHDQRIAAHVDKAKFQSDDAARICSIGMANYFAGATSLPYKSFHAAAIESRHDLNYLANQFDTSIEQVAHRLSTLQRPKRLGVPIFFARIDRAGNITKRHSATKLQFARFGSACPIWNAHQAFESAGKIIRQLAQTPDGVKYLCLAVTVDKPSVGPIATARRYSLALGCEIKYRDQFVYSDGLDIDAEGAFEPIGVSCRICERPDCEQRAVPPSKSQLDINPNNRTVIPYSIVSPN